MTRSMPTTAELIPLPVLCQGQAHDLRVDTGEFRLWTARTGLADGEPYENTVYVEAYDRFIDPTRSVWMDLGHYDGDDPPRGLPGCTPHALQGELR